MTRITAARGPQLRCRGWRQEGLLRMLENVLEVGEDPDRLVVYAALGQAARDWDAYHQLVASLTELGDDETLVVQSGKPIGVFPSRPDAPLVVMACTNLVGRWATEHHFYELVDRGLTMWGGLTAGDWQYIGAQGVLQGVYELLGAIGREHFDGSLVGRLVVTAGLGGMGSAQPTAIRMTGAVGLIAEADPVKLSRAADRGALDETHDDLDAALARCAAAVRDGGPLVVGVAANAADVCATLVERGVTPDVVTDLTAAHDLRHGYLPQGLDVDAWRRLRAEDPHEVERRARASICAHVGALLALKARGAVVVENGNNLRAQAHEGGVVDAYQIDQFSARYIRPLFCDGIGPSAGWRSAVTTVTSRCSTTSRPRSSPTNPASSSGSGSPAPTSRSRGCRPATAGSATASARPSPRPSTPPSPTDGSRRRCCSPATTSTPAE